MARWEQASAKAKSPKHFKELMNEPGNYLQRQPSEAYRKGWDRIFGKEKDDEQNGNQGADDGSVRSGTDS